MIGSGPFRFFDPAKVSALFLQRSFPGYFHATGKAGNQSLRGLVAGLRFLVLDPFLFQMSAIQPSHQDQRKWYQHEKDIGHRAFPMFSRLGVTVDC